VIFAGGHFYDSAGFWGPAAGVVVGLLAIAATVWVTLRAANPKRRLYYAMLADTPLITGRHHLSKELKVTYGTRELASPRVVNIRLTSRGRRDIAREAFDEGKPLRLDLGTPIIECVKVTTSPPDRPDPSYAVDGSKLLIGPSHFGRRQTTVFSLLVDGKTPEIAKPPRSLVDVDLRPEDPQAQESARWLAGAGGVMVFQGGIVLALILSGGPHKNGEDNATLIVVGALFLVLGVAALTVSIMSRLVR
jgi:hypothetical protein